MSKGKCKDARIALGAVGPSPFRSSAAEDLLKEKPVDDEELNRRQKPLS